MPDPWAKATPQDTPEEAEERKKLGGYTLAECDEIAMDPALWARVFGRVSERVSKLPIPFEPSTLQLRMFGHYKHCQDHKLPCRMITVKIRRGGGSTGAAALLYLHAHNYRARLGGVGTNDTVSMNIFEMIRYFDKHDAFPAWKKADKVLETGYIRWPGGSSWERYTAENPEAARSAGLQGYHGTEIGRWQDGGAKDAKETLRSMLGAVPRRDFTVVIEESTAQGAQGAFYDRFTGGRWPTAEELGVAEGREYWRLWAGETPQNVAADEAERVMQFVRVFSAWFEDDENRPGQGLSPEGVERIKLTQTPEEKDLIDRYRTIGPQGERLGYTAVKATLWEQLAWRRATIATEFEGDVDAFAQENPSSPKEAFQSSGRHTFNVAGTAWMVDQAKQAKFNTPGILMRQPNGGVIFKQTDRATALFVQHIEPQEGHRYLVSVDTCGGRSNQKNPDAADYNAPMVLRARYRNEAGVPFAPCVVMTMMPKNQMDPDVLAEQCKLMADYYGGCITVFEVNNTGAAFRQEAVRLGMHLYREVVTDKGTSEQTEYVGWQTTKETRPQLIATLKKHIRNNADPLKRHEGVQVYSPVIAKECADMVLSPDGKDAAPSNSHDDWVLSLGMALQCESSATMLKFKVRKRQNPPDLKDWKMARW